ncbi:oligosaccharide flippase family protein [Sulfurimonas sp.]|uniref:lipopolysaccharide biosynthesis protein n=1 Tax=Sulfurimonas sp. TaxID=2022749 RepID=UPI00262E4D5E|nr:oligosaccharide flippase family protein [Sulfurimonas sp.]
MLNKLKPKSEFSKNVLTLMTGTTIAQAIPIAISPILTRIYTPEYFGVFALYLAIVGFISIVITARYEMAIVLPRSDEEAINILALALLITVSLVVLTTLIMLLFKDEILQLFNAQSVGNLIFLVPISLLFAGLIQTFNYWSNRKEYFKAMSSSQIAQSFAIGSMQPLLGYFSINGGLILGNILGRAVAAFVLVDKFVKNDKECLKEINKKSMITQMKKYKDFPLVNSLHAFSDILRSSGSVMLISTFFGTTVLGFYALSLRALQVPVGIIGSALGQVLYKKFTTLHNNGEDLYSYAKSVVVKLFLIAVPFFVLLFFIAPELFAFVFGEKWRVAGEYSQLLIPYLFMNFLISPISHIPIILEKQKKFFYLNLIVNIGMLLILFVGNIFHYDFTTLLCSISLFMCSFYIYTLWWFKRILQASL